VRLPDPSVNEVT